MKKKSFIYTKNTNNLLHLLHTHLTHCIIVVYSVTDCKKNLLQSVTSVTMLIIKQLNLKICLEITKNTR